MLWFTKSSGSPGRLSEVRFPAAAHRTRLPGRGARGRRRAAPIGWSLREVLDLSLQRSKLQTCWKTTEAKVFQPSRLVLISHWRTPQTVARCYGKTNWISTIDFRVVSCRWDWEMWSQKVKGNPIRVYLSKTIHRRIRKRFKTRKQRAQWRTRARPIGLIASSLATLSSKKYRVFERGNISSSPWHQLSAIGLFRGISSKQMIKHLQKTD